MMNMDFPVKDIERFFEEALLLEGEHLLDQAAVQTPVELEKNLWLTQVADCEVEVQISPSKVRAYSCDCTTYQQDGQCAHIVAALLNLRRLIQERQQEKNSNPPRQRTAPHKLTIPKILENVDREEMLLFIREYARTNRSFALALKARFAGAVPLMDDRKKYRQLLDSVINSARSKQDQLTYRATQKLIKVLEELLTQSEASLADRDFSEVLHILEAIVEKISPIIKKAKGHEEKLKAILQESFSQLERLLAKMPAPSLKNDIWLFLLEESKKSVYLHSFSTFNQLYPLLIQLADDPHRMETIRELFSDILQRREPKRKYRAKMHIWSYELLKLERKHAEAEQYLINNLHQPEFLLFAVQQAFEHGEFKRAKFLSHKGLQEISSTEIREEIVEVLLQIALQEEQQDQVYHYALQRLLSTKQYRYYEFLKQARPDNWEACVKEVLTLLRTQPYSLEQRDLLARLLQENNRKEELLNYIRQLNSLDLLIRYDYLFTDQQAQLTELYNNLTLQYLRSHLGRKTSQKVRDTLQHLYASGQDAIGAHLLQNFRQEFSERHTLMEELDVFPLTQ